MIEDVDLGLKRTATISIEILWKVFMVTEDVDIVLRPATLPTISQVIMLDSCVYLLLLIVFVELFMSMKEVKVVVMMQDMELGLKITATITFTITEKVLTMMGEVNIGIKSSPIPPIIQVSLIYSCVFCSWS